MRWSIPCLLVLCQFIHSPAQQLWKPSPHVAATDPLPPEKQLKKFHLPEGFEIQLVAAEPEINKPININFDAKGRLFVTGSVEYPYAAKGKGRDKVWILEDFAANGRARKVTTFAEGLNIPIGVLPTSKGAIVYSIPNIYHMIDTKGTGKADKWDVLFSDYGHGDTHGMTGEFVMGFDGWVYACHGFANTSKVKDKTGKVQIEMHSGNVYRFKPDGSKIEYFTHGQVNPFGLAFDPSGNLYSCDCHSRPIYQLLKGAWYPSFQKPHDGLGFGPEMMTHSHGSTAIGGIAYYAADHFPKEYQDNIFIGNVVTNRINRDRLEWVGSSPKAIEMPDLVKCDDPWFRPVDIKLGPDGALYVADFYNRIIGHYEVPLDHPGRDRDKGRIWRIVYKGVKDQVPLPKIEDLTKLKTADLVDRLNHPNLAVSMQAINLLVEREGPDVKKLVGAMLEKSDYSIFPGLYVLERIRTNPGPELDREIAFDPNVERHIENAAKSEHKLSRIHAMRIMGEGSWKEAKRKVVQDRLSDADPMVRRIAFETLGKFRNFNIDGFIPMLRAREEAFSSKDTHLIHTIRMAIRNQLIGPRAWEDLKAFRTLLKENESAAIADVCTGLRSQESAAFLLDHLDKYPESKANLGRYAHHIARYGPESASLKLLTLITQKIKPEGAVQAAMVKGIQQGIQERGGKLAGEFSKDCEKLARSFLASSAETEIQLGIDLALALKLSAVKGELLTVIRSGAAKEPHRRSAVAALAVIEPGKHVDLFGKILTDSAEPPSLREQVAQSLGASNLPLAQDTLLKALATAPARLEKPIALALASNKQGGEKLLDAVAAGKASPRLLQDQPLVVRLRDAKIANLDVRLKKLTAGLPPADERLFKMLAQRRDGFLKAKTDSALGAKVFTKNCANCHQLNNEGSKIGPQLDGIGIRGLERILEDVLDPNRNVDQAFRATTLTLKNGQILNGLLIKQEGKVLIMADGLGKEQRIETDAVETRAISPLSPMPATFAEGIPEDEFNHLLAFLLAQTVKSK